MRVTRLLPLILVILLPLISVSATAQGNSENAHACHQGGYLFWTDAEGNGFSNVGQCVRYAARGGELYPVPSLHVAWPKPGTFTDSTPMHGWLIGSGLQPDAPVFLANRGNTGPQYFTVAADGIIDVVLHYPDVFVCGIVEPHFVTTTRTGDPIRTYEYPDPPCHRDEWL